MLSKGFTHKKTMYRAKSASDLHRPRTSRGSVTTLLFSVLLKRIAQFFFRLKHREDVKDKEKGD
jgi:hypothetical protein